jgi:uncharacterized membrane protein YagU involved in acid resistance
MAFTVQSFMRNNLWKQLAFGAVAGFAGSMAIQALLMAHQKVSPQTMPPINQDPGEFMLGKAKAALPRKARQRVPKQVEAVSAKLLGLGYGMTFGAVYAMARPKTQRTILEGALLGIATWAVGYLGWLPAAKLMPPVWKQKPAQVIVPVAEHALYGMATVAGYRWLKERAE